MIIQKINWSNLRSNKSAKRCIFNNDLCNTLIDAILEADGVILESPVYFSGANSALCALLDRVFYSTCTWHQMFAGKPAAAVVLVIVLVDLGHLNAYTNTFFAAKCQLFLVMNLWHLKKYLMKN